MIKLIFSQPEFGRQFVELPDGTFSVGRSSRSHIIVEEGSVSQRHADLQIHGTEVIVSERGSLNGTFIDGVRIKTQSGARHGQRIRFGRVELLLDLGEPLQDEATDITAGAIFREPAAMTGENLLTPARFSLRFIPAAQFSEDRHTVSLPNPALSAAAVQNLAAPPNRSGGLWFWRIVGTGTLFVVVSWLLKR
jgi:hypothetical protein